MKIEIIRQVFTEFSTIGQMFINGDYFGYTLEDVDRQRQADGTIIKWSKDLKKAGETAIPYGRYEVITNYSPRFKKVMPLIKDVPNFSGVRIHSGNEHTDTEGCPLIGFTKSDNFVGQSKMAFTSFMKLLRAGLKLGVVILTISKDEADV